MPAGELQFSASYDKSTKILTVVLGVLLAAIAFILTMNMAIIGGGVAAVIMLMYGVAYAYSPRDYVSSDRSMVVRRLAGNVRIPLDGIRDARAGTKDDLAGCIRLWGNGGVFGYYGLFQTSKLGRCRWYVTNRRNAVVVVTDQQTTLFSPDDVDGFLVAIRESVPVTETLRSELSPPPVGSMRNQAGSILGVAIAVVVLGVVAAAFLYSPGPPQYMLTGTSLTIHDRFYPMTVNASDVDVDGIRVVDIGQDSGWRPTERTDGFANSNYHSGWFRVANGQKVRMYWAKSRNVVLLPPKGQGNAVLLEVAQPERFVDDLRQVWAKHS